MKKTAILTSIILVLTSFYTVWAKTLEENLIDAVRKTDISELKDAIDNRANLNYVDLNEEFPLMIAVSKQWIPGIKLLVENGANISQVNFNKQTALMIAARDCENDNILEYLVKNGANLNARDNTGKTALMYATENQNTRVLKYLVKMGANIEETDIHGNNTVMWAIKSKNNLLLQYFIDQGNINWSHTNDEGNTAFMLAILSSDAIMLRTFLTSNTDFDIYQKVNKDKPLLFWAIERKVSSSIIDYLMDQYDPEKLLTEKDSLGRKLEYYIKKNKDDNAKRKLDEIKKEWNLK